MTASPNAKSIDLGDYQALAEALPQLIWLADAAGHVNYVNSQWLAFTGQTREEAMGPGAADATHPLDRHRVLSEWAGAVRAGGSIEVEQRMRRADGSYRWCVTRGAPIKDEHGLVQGWAGTTTDIHDQKSSRASLDVVIEMMGDAFFAVDSEWRFTHLNRQAEALLRHAEGDLLGRNLWASFPEAVGSEFERNYRHAMKSGEVVEFEARYPTLDLLVEVRACRTDAGLSVFFRDVARRHRLEAERREALATLQAVLDNAPVGFAFWDKDLRFRQLNRTLAEMNGFPIEEHIGRTIRDLLPEFADVGERVRGQVLETGRPLIDVVLSGETKSAPGVTRHWRESFYPISTDGEEVVGLGAVVIDVTAQMRAEDRTRRLQEVTSALAEAYTMSEMVEVIADGVLPAIGASAIGVAIHDAATGELSLAGARGYSEDWRRTWTHVTLDAPVPLADAVRALRPVFLPDFAAASTAYPGVFEEASARGRKSWASLPLVVKGRAFGGLALSFDEAHDFDQDESQYLMTVARQCAVSLDRARLYEEERAAREDLEDKVRARTRELEERNAEQETFVYTASHDLRQPLLSIQGMSSLLTDALEIGDEEQVKYLTGRIIANTSKMSDLLNDLLALSRIGRVDGESISVNLRDVANQAISELEDRIAHAQVRLDLPEEWPTVVLPRGEAYQLVANLVGNAVKFAGRPGHEPRVRVGWREVEGMVSLRVEDNGPGVPDLYRKRVFKLFAKLNNDGEGTGVGLAIVKRIAERSGGRAWVEESTDLGGAAFVATLPNDGDGTAAGDDRRPAVRPRDDSGES